MEKPLTGKVALVTGGSRGIGAATASVLTGRGFRVVVNYHASAPEAEEVVAAISAAGGEAVAIQADVTAPGDVARMAGDIDQRWGGVDVLVHNALIPYVITSFAELTWEQLGGKLDRELQAAFLMTKAVVPCFPFLSKISCAKHGLLPWKPTADAVPPLWAPQTGKYLQP